MRIFRYYLVQSQCLIEIYLVRFKPTYRTLNKASWDKNPGICPLKLLLDKSLKKPLQKIVNLTCNPAKFIWRMMLVMYTYKVSNCVRLTIQGTISPVSPLVDKFLNSNDIHKCVWRWKLNTPFHYANYSTYNDIILAEWSELW